MDYHVVSNSVAKTLPKEDREEPDTMQIHSGLKTKLKLKLKVKLKLKSFHSFQKHFAFKRPPLRGQFCYRFTPLKNGKPF